MKIRLIICFSGGRGQDTIYAVQHVNLVGGERGKTCDSNVLKIYSLWGRGVAPYIPYIKVQVRFPRSLPKIQPRPMYCMGGMEKQLLKLCYKGIIQN